MSIKSLLSFILVALFSLNTTAQNWDLKKEKKGIKVWTSDKAGSKFKQCKSEVEIKSTIDEAVNYITNPDNYLTHSTRIKKLKTLKKLDNGAYYYLAVNLPALFSDRHGAYYVSTKSKTNDKAVVTIEAKPKLVKELDGYTTVLVSNTKYTFTKTSTGVKLSMTMYTEPNGNIPSSFANFFLVDSPLEICTAIRNDLETKSF